LVPKYHRRGQLAGRAGTGDNRAVRILATGALVLLCACGHDSSNCASVACPAALPVAISITVTDARGAALIATPTITNLVPPAGATRSQTSCTLSAGRAVCSVDAGVPGHYEFDIGATGYATQHLKADVAPGPTGGCCPQPYAPVSLTVALSP
jgi:hypothetical protein